MSRAIVQTSTDTHTPDGARRAIGDVALAVAEELDPKRAARAVVEQTRRVLGADGVLLWEVVEQDEYLRLLAHRGIPMALVGKLRWLSFTAPTLSSRAARTGQLQVQEDMREVRSDFTITRELAEGYGFRSMVAVPLKARGRLVGVMTYTTKALHRFTPEQLDTVTTIGRIFAIGLDNAKAYARERELLSEVQALVASSPEGILLIEAPTGRPLLVNNATEAILGHPVVPDAHLEDYPVLYGLRHPNGAPISVEDLPLTRAFRGQTVLGLQLMIRQPSGKEVPVLVSAAPVRNEKGNVVAGVILFQDISQLKELERQREQMTSIVAHDLRAPIAVIIGYADLLLGKADHYGIPEQPRVVLQRMRDSAKSLDRLVGDLMDVTRLQTRRLSLRRQWVDLPALVRDLVARLSAAITTHSVSVEVHGEVPQVWVDPGRVEQILTNLITNAAKYSAPGTSIKIALRRRDGDVVVSVADQGQGIPPQELANVFQPYYRLRTPGAAPEGLGLGLFITKGLVEALGGRIWVDSQLGVGTTFHVTFPTTPTAVRPRRSEKVQKNQAASRVGKSAPPSVRAVTGVRDNAVRRQERQDGAGAKTSC